MLKSPLILVRATVTAKRVAQLASTALRLTNAESDIAGRRSSSLYLGLLYAAYTAELVTRRRAAGRYRRA